MLHSGKKGREVRGDGAKGGGMSSKESIGRCSYREGGRGGEGEMGQREGGMSLKESMGRCTEKGGEGGGERQWDTQQEGMRGEKREDGTELNVIRQGTGLLQCHKNTQKDTRTHMHTHAHTHTHRTHTMYTHTHLDRFCRVLKCDHQHIPTLIRHTKTVEGL